MELARNRAVAQALAQDVAVTSPITVIVRVRDTSGLLRTLDGIAVQRPQPEVVIAFSPDLDGRARSWLDALAQAERWQTVTASTTTPGAAWNAGLVVARTPWLLLLDNGDVLTTSACGDLVQNVPLTRDDVVLAGRVRVLALGVDELFAGPDADAPKTLHPTDPGIRAIAWPRLSLTSAGAFDESLAVLSRYEAWFRLLAAGVRARRLDAALIAASAEPNHPIRRELADPAYASTLEMILSRHEETLQPHLADLLASRDKMRQELALRHAAATRRRERATSQIARLRSETSEAERLQALAAANPPSSALARRVSPLSRSWGYERGGPVDRVYIESFLHANASHIRGTVLEIQESSYTERFGKEAVTRSDVLDITDTNERATVLTDLRRAVNLPDNSYDCIILTQTLHVIDDMRAVALECRRLLKPGGVLLATMPAVSRVCLEYGRDGDFWRVTPAGARRLFEPVFGAQAVAVETFGNALVGSAFLFGLGASELTAEEFASTDAYNPVLVGIRALKQTGDDADLRTVAVHASYDTGVILLYHRVGATGPDPHGISLPADVLDQQLQWLAEHCAPLPVQELVARAASGTLPRRAVAVTFDDGYVDVLHSAAPLLQHYDIPATCFATTECLDEATVFWWDWLAALLLGEEAPPPVMTIELPDGEHLFATRTRGERYHAHWRLFHSLVPLEADRRSRVINALRAWAPTLEVHPNARRMTAPEMRTLLTQGVAIEAHTVRHLALPCHGPEVQMHEILQSRNTLERVLGRPVTALAYPFGAFDEVSVESCRRAGVTFAVTCEPRAVTCTDDSLRVPRVEIRQQELSRFVAHLEPLLAS